VVGENLAWGTGAYSAAKAIVQEWLASPEHRANLLRPGFRLVGVGSAVGTFVGRAGATVVTADFAGR
ncbi:MAG: CAP domain-containing protein, partial [Actinobacteria bacterium]